MTTTKIVTGVACVVAAVAVGTAVWERSGKLSALARVAALQAEVAGARRVENIDTDAAPAKVESRARVTEAPKTEPLAPVKDPAAEELLANVNSAYAHSDIWEARMHQFKASLPFIYGSLSERLYAAMFDVGVISDPEGGVPSPPRTYAHRLDFSR